MIVYNERHNILNNKDFSCWLPNPHWPNHHGCNTNKFTVKFNLKKIPSVLCLPPPTSNLPRIRCGSSPTVFAIAQIKF